MTENLILINDTSRLLSAKERQNLSAIENKVKADLHFLSSLVKHLNEVDQYHLWREDYGSFKQYCARRWAIESRLVFMLHGILNVGDTLPHYHNHTKPQH